MASFANFQSELLYFPKLFPIFVGPHFVNSQYTPDKIKLIIHSLVRNFRTHLNLVGIYPHFMYTGIAEAKSKTNNLYMSLKLIA
jgi:hypothetical protein